MSTVVHNPTNRLEEKFQETFTGQYLGKTFDIKPGAKIELEDKTARHLLNNFAPRGLISLVYGDEGSKEEKKIKDALERNRAFKIKQINDLNQKNSANKHMGLPYLEPTKIIRRYAEEMGAKLEESYKIDDTQLQKTQALEKENIDLKTQMALMNEKMNQILEQINKPVKEIKEGGEIFEDIPMTKNGKPDKRFKGG